MASIRARELDSFGLEKLRDEAELVGTSVELGKTRNDGETVATAT